MLLKELLGKDFVNFRKNDYFENLQFRKVCCDVEKVQNGDLYFCLTHNDEKALTRCEKALEKGAAAVVSDLSLPIWKAVQVADVRGTFARACANFYQHACDDLKIVGITGTNGKTTTSHVVAEMLKRNGRKVGVIGTNGVFYDGKKFDCPLTTPDADFLHKTFLDMKNAGMEYVVMEVSAHAIDQKRIDGIKFELGVLTNVTQDHLDYFDNLQNYEATKLSFFTPDHIKKGVVCADDESARKLLEKCDVPLVSYGLCSPSDAFAIDVCCTINGSRFTANICDDVVEIRTNLIGNYNVENSLAALCVCQSLGLGGEELARGLNYINPVEGRFNVINFSGKHVVIDFAHSPDGLMNVLKTARGLTDKKLFVVFGCGGNRDKGKRPQMGAIAEKFADYVCLTDDNPRLECSQDIISDIEKGMKKPHFIESDRSKAIVKMINLAKHGDIVLIAGKGAEKYQEIGTEKHPYNDFDVVYQHFKDLNPERKTGREKYDC
ncbi:MAG: UDP-N-acetylmuramoyl-L-alanyl-D-glutamate--2,6-diaminopimelate ligase [Clostridia bacterium]|nr:UDP-N-acetylmuramoyl-L-alanyl-D-glutamate--2,6-diaminopimelate ligase [Clostridia bacterium]